LKVELAAKKTEISQLCLKVTEFDMLKNEVLPGKDEKIQELSGKVENIENKLRTDKEQWDTMAIGYEDRISNFEIKNREAEKSKRIHNQLIEDYDILEERFRKSENHLNSLIAEKNILKLDECCQTTELGEDPRFKKLEIDLEISAKKSVNQVKSIEKLNEEIVGLKADLDTKNQNCVDFSHEKRVMKLNFDRQIHEMQNELDEQLAENQSKFKIQIESLSNENNDFKNRIKNDFVSKIEFEKISEKLLDAEEMLDEKSQLFNKLEAKNSEIDQELIKTSSEKENIQNNFSSLEAKISSLEKKTGPKR